MSAWTLRWLIAAFTVPETQIPRPAPSGTTAEPHPPVVGFYRGSQEGCSVSSDDSQARANHPANGSSALTSVLLKATGRQWAPSSRAQSMGCIRSILRIARWGPLDEGRNLRTLVGTPRLRERFGSNLPILRRAERTVPCWFSRADALEKRFLDKLGMTERNGICRHLPNSCRPDFIVSRGFSTFWHRARGWMSPVFYDVVLSDSDPRKEIPRQGRNDGGVKGFGRRHRGSAYRRPSRTR